MASQSARQALMALPHERLASLALKARKQARNQAIDRQRLKARLFSAGSAMAGAAVAGRVVGRAMAIRDQHQAQIDAGQMEDPTKLFGMDADLGVGLIFMAGGIAVQALSKSETLTLVGEVVEGAGTGALGFWLGSRVSEHAYEEARSEQQFQAMPFPQAA